MPETPSAVSYPKLFTTEKVYQTFQDWNKTNKVLRFGQYFINNYVPTTVDPDLFFEKDAKQALQMTLAHYAQT